MIQNVVIPLVNVIKFERVLVELLLEQVLVNLRGLELFRHVRQQAEKHNQQ